MDSDVEFPLQKHSKTGCSTMINDLLSQTKERFQDDLNLLLSDAYWNYTPDVQLRTAFWYQRIAFLWRPSDVTNWKLVPGLSMPRLRARRWGLAWWLPRTFPCCMPWQPTPPKHWDLTINLVLLKHFLEKFCAACTWVVWGDQTNTNNPT